MVRRGFTLRDTSLAGRRRVSPARDSPALVIGITGGCVEGNMMMRGSWVRRTMLALSWAGALAASPGSVAEIYKWVDQKGVTNYSGTPPATGKAQTLDLAATTVSVYPTTAQQDAARLDAMLRRRLALLEDELRAERQARQTLQAAYQTDAGLAYEACLRERRVDCDSGRDGVPAGRYFHAPAPVFVLGRGPLVPLWRPYPPFPRHPPPAIGTTGGHRAGVSARNAGQRGSPRKFR